MNKQRELHKIYLRMRLTSVFFLKNILEGFDNQYILTTLDTQTGIVSISYTEGSDEELIAILDSIKEITAHEILNPKPEQDLMISGKIEDDHNAQ